MSGDVESLRSWSHVLMVTTVVVPVMGGILGGLAGYARYRIDQRVAAISAALKDAELARVRARTEPRGLTAEQRTTLVAALRPHPAHVELVYIGGAEAERYSEQIQAALIEAGWSVKVEPAIAGGLIGMRVMAGDDAAPASALLSALQTAGVALSHPPLIRNPNSGEIPTGSVKLEVGSKPL